MKGSRKAAVLLDLWASVKRGRSRELDPGQPASGKDGGKGGRPGSGSPARGAAA